MNDFSKPFIVRDRRNGEWYWVQKGVLSSKEIKPSAKLVYNALAYFANNKNQTAFPSATRIAKMININRDTVFQALKSLEDKKFIAIERKPGKVNYYTLLKVVGNSDQSEIRDKGSRNKGTGVVGNKDTNNTYLTRPTNNSESFKKDVDKSIPIYKQQHKLIKRKVVSELKKDLIAKKVLSNY